ncbi:MAG TPA: sigma 54-interacting transcriptional regulator [Bryobacteraceae bacterium]|nr:sigma 54-interacting transcriptional regulator [Bryobacteraceae bacterium]
MIPQLVAIDGPLKGSAYAIADGRFSIGRKPDNTLSQADLSVSRHHCTIECAGDSFVITDHDSQNGTFVNGIPIKQRTLCHGDQIAVGASVFTFLLDEGPAPPAAASTAARYPVVGETPLIRHVLEFVAQVAPLDGPVLIAGEPGTGKRLMAHALHDAGLRARRPFVAVNCAALSETFLGRELFGYERGAFPGAVDRKEGKLALAEGGTLFLDEVGALPVELQAKLLRLLNHKQFQRLGSAAAATADVRVIAATGRDISAAVGEGSFQPDLYFRLKVLSVEIPPLRYRREDIPLLANYFRVEQSTRQKRRVLGITAAARDCLLRYDWPGNVRQLECAIESAVAVGSTEGILPEDLPEAVLPGRDAPQDLVPRYHREIHETRRELVLKAYTQGGSHARAAAILGLHPHSLARLVRALGLQSAIEQLGGGQPHLD